MQNMAYWPSTQASYTIGSWSCEQSFKIINRQLKLQLDTQNPFSDGVIYVMNLFGADGNRSEARELATTPLVPDSVCSLRYGIFNVDRQQYYNIDCHFLFYGDRETLYT